LGGIEGASGSLFEIGKCISRAEIGVYQPWERFKN
jgi:hypothetical protein